MDLSFLTFSGIMRSATISFQPDSPMYKVLLQMNASNVSQNVSEISEAVGLDENIVASLLQQLYQGGLVYIEQQEHYTLSRYGKTIAQYVTTQSQAETYNYDIPTTATYNKIFTLFKKSPYILKDIVISRLTTPSARRAFADLIKRGIITETGEGYQLSVVGQAHTKYRAEMTTLSDAQLEEAYQYFKQAHPEYKYVYKFMDTHPDNKKVLFNDIRKYIKGGIIADNFSPQNVPTIKKWWGGENIPPHTSIEAAIGKEIQYMASEIKHVGEAAPTMDDVKTSRTYVNMLVSKTTPEVVSSLLREHPMGSVLPDSVIVDMAKQIVGKAFPSNLDIESIVDAIGQVIKKNRDIKLGRFLPTDTVTDMVPVVVSFLRKGKDGIEAFNLFVSEATHAEIVVEEIFKTNKDFRGLDLHGVQLPIKASNVNFSGCNFSNAQLENAVFIDCNFSPLNGKNVRFSGANLVGSTFSGCNLDYADFENAVGLGESSTTFTNNTGTPLNFFAISGKKSKEEWQRAIEEPQKSHLEVMMDSSEKELAKVLAEQLRQFVYKTAALHWKLSKLSFIATADIISQLPSTKPDEKIVNVLWAVYCAEAVIKIFEDAYPNDNRPRAAIDAARLWLKQQTKETADAAYTAAHAAYTAANAAYTAAYAVYAAAYAAAYAASSAADAAYVAHAAAHAAHAAADAARLAGIPFDASVLKIKAEQDAWMYVKSTIHIRFEKTADRKQDLLNLLNPKLPIADWITKDGLIQMVKDGELARLGIDPKVNGKLIGRVSQYEKEKEQVRSKDRYEEFAEGYTPTQQQVSTFAQQLSTFLEANKNQHLISREALLKLIPENANDIRGLISAYGTNQYTQSVLNVPQYGLTHHDLEEISLQLSRAIHDVSNDASAKISVEKRKLHYFAYTSRISPINHGDYSDRGEMHLNYPETFGMILEPSTFGISDPDVRKMVDALTVHNMWRKNKLHPASGHWKNAVATSRIQPHIVEQKDIISAEKNMKKVWVMVELQSDPYQKNVYTLGDVIDPQWTVPTNKAWTETENKIGIMQLNSEPHRMLNVLAEMKKDSPDGINPNSLGEWGQKDSTTINYTLDELASDWDVNEAAVNDFKSVVKMFLKNGTIPAVLLSSEKGQGTSKKQYQRIPNGEVVVTTLLAKRVIVPIFVRNDDAPIYVGADGKQFNKYQADSTKLFGIVSKAMTNVLKDAIKQLRDARLLTVSGTSGLIQLTDYGMTTQHIYGKLSKFRQHYRDWPEMVILETINRALDMGIDEIWIPSTSEYMKAPNTARDLTTYYDEAAKKFTNQLISPPFDIKDGGSSLWTGVTEDYYPKQYYVIKVSDWKTPTKTSALRFTASVYTNFVQQYVNKAKTVYPYLNDIPEQLLIESAFAYLIENGKIVNEPANIAAIRQDINDEFATSIQGVPTNYVKVLVNGKVNVNKNLVTQVQKTGEEPRKLAMELFMYLLSAKFPQLSVVIVEDLINIFRQLIDRYPIEFIGRAQQEYDSMKEIGINPNQEGDVGQTVSPSGEPMGEDVSEIDKLIRQQQEQEAQTETDIQFISPSAHEQHTLIEEEINRLLDALHKATTDEDKNRIRKRLHEMSTLAALKFGSSLKFSDIISQLPSTKPDERIVNVLWAVYCAEAVIKIFEDAYPNDNRPRAAIDAARLWLKHQTKETANAAYTAYTAYAATNAAHAAADAAHAAYAAAYAAYVADTNAAYVAAAEAADAARLAGIPFDASVLKIKAEQDAWMYVKRIESSLKFASMNVMAHIEERNGKWVVLNKKRTKVLGTHPSKASAERQLRAIEMHKHHGSLTFESMAGGNGSSPRNDGKEIATKRDWKGMLKRMLKRKNEDAITNMNAPDIMPKKAELYLLPKRENRNTGKEVILGETLHYGVGDDVYMYREDAVFFGLQPDVDYVDSQNHVFVCLTDLGEKHIVQAMNRFEGDNYPWPWYHSDKYNEYRKTRVTSALTFAAVDQEFNRPKDVLKETPRNDGKEIATKRDWKGMLKRMLKRKNEDAITNMNAPDIMPKKADIVTDMVVPDYVQYQQLPYRDATHVIVRHRDGTSLGSSYMHRVYISLAFARDDGSLVYLGRSPYFVTWGYWASHYLTGMNKHDQQQYNNTMAYAEQLAEKLTEYVKQHPKAKVSSITFAAVDQEFNRFKDKKTETPRNDFFQYEPANDTAAPVGGGAKGDGGATDTSNMDMKGGFYTDLNLPDPHRKEKELVQFEPSNHVNLQPSFIASFDFTRFKQTVMSGLRATAEFAGMDDVTITEKLYQDWVFAKENDLL